MKKTKKIQFIIGLLYCALFFFCIAFVVNLAPVFKTKAETVTYSEDMYCAGASIRLSNEKDEDGHITNGIRFHVRIPSDESGNVTLDETEYSFVGLNGIETHIEITPDDTSLISQTVERTGGWKLSDDKTYVETKAYVYGIPEEYYEMNFTYRAYYVNADGEKIYAQKNGNNTRSVSSVALEAKIEDVATKDAEGESAGYTGDLLTALNDFLPDIIGGITFKNTDKYLYRVGNQNDVALSSLFSLTMENDDFYKIVDVEAGENSIYNNGTQQLSFEGMATGVKTLTFKVKYSELTDKATLPVEVVNAKNITSAENAEKNNIVLLNDISGTFTVSNGYAFYGNGFKVICSGNGSYGSKALSFGFITVSDGGTLDNVQVICDIFPESYLYTGEMTADSNGQYPYAKSAVSISGNSVISNSYIYGARNNIFVGSGNVIIENTVTECGSLSNIQIKSSDAYTVTLKDLTTIQYQTTSTYDSTKTVLGFGVVVGDNESASNAKLKLEGDLIQYNWVTSDDTSVSNSYARTAIENALKVEEYQHTDNGTTTVNMGIAYLNAQMATITDERTNTEITYNLKTISIGGYNGQVYSITNGGEVPYSNDDKKGYSPNQNGYILPTVSFNGYSEAVTFESGYNSTEGTQVNKLTVDLDNIDGGSYDFSFANLKVEKYGKTLEYSVKDLDGNAVDKNTITLNQLFTDEYILVVTDNLIYDVNGETTGESKTVELPFTIQATKTSIDPPEFTNAETATAIRLVESSGGDWRPAYTVLTGVSVTYWSASESKVKTVDLSTLYNSGTISSNVWTYTCDDYTLTITGGAVHSDGSVITPVVADNTLYFASTNKAFGTGTTSRNIILTYVFTDKNASTTWNRTETVTYSELSEYDYDSFKNNGTLTEASSGSGSCLAEDTLITMADGTKRAVQDIRKGDVVMAFDHVTGVLTTNKVIIVVKTESAFYKNKFIFDDGTELATINEHGIFDLALNKYVNIDHENYKEYIGHDFVSIDKNGNIGSKKLIDLVSVYESGYKYDIVTNQTLNYVAEDTLSVTHVLVDIINTFEFGENLTYNQELMQADIEKYGLYTYEEWAEYCDISVFEEYNIAIMKIGVSKGFYTQEYIISLINTYVLNDNVQIMD